MADMDPELEALRKRFYTGGEAPEMPTLRDEGSSSSTVVNTRTNAKGKGRERTFASSSRSSRGGALNGGGRSDAMDIDSDPSAAGFGRASSSTLVDLGHNIPDRAQETDVQRLMRAWQNERHAPDILPMEEGALGRVLDAVRRQTSDVNTLRMDDDLTEEDHYMMMLVQTEVERMKFVVRSYVRTRLWKIEKYAAYVMDPESKQVQQRLTEAELRHAQRYSSLLVKQFEATILNHLPESQQGLDDHLDTMPSMITKPDLEKPVFVRALEDCGKIMLPNGTPFELTKGSIHLMRYRTIEQQLLRGEVELV